MVLIEHLEGVRKTGAGRWLAKCPAHADRTASLSVRELDDGRILAHCFAGCSAHEVVAAAGLSLSDLFPERPQQHAKRERRPFPAADALRCIAFEALVAAASCVSMTPRLMASGADMTRIWFVGDTNDHGERRSFDPSRDTAALRHAIAEAGGAALLIVDPVVSAIAGDSQHPDARDLVKATIKPPGTLKRAESIASWWETEAPAAVEESYRKQALDAAVGEIVSVAWASDDCLGATVAIRSKADDERIVLAQFFGQLQAHLTANAIRTPDGRELWESDPFFICHNAQFDLGFLWRRCIVLGIRPPFTIPAPNAKPGSYGCTMTAWAGVRGTISLDKLCSAHQTPIRSNPSKARNILNLCEPNPNLCTPEFLLSLV